MKRVFFVLVVFFAMATASAQEKGLHLTLGGGLGWTNFAYNLDDGCSKGRLGYGGTIGAQYFFSRHWGISLAGEFYVFNTQSRFDKDKGFLFPNQVDDQEDIYDFHLHLINWKESQKTYFLEIPLMGVYQHKFGKKERHGLYFGLGVKAQIPVSTSSYERAGDVKAWGHYPEWNVDLGLPVELPHHGYGTNKNRDWHGENTLKTSFAAVGEFGFLFGLSRRVDLTLGVVADYGFRNISGKEEQLLGPVSGVTQQDGSYVAENVFYNGVLNSDMASQINPWSVRGKIGLRIKIGKLKPIDDDAEEDTIEDIARPPRTPIIDTIFVYPVIKYVQPDDDGTGDGSDGKGGMRPSSRNYYEPIPEEDEAELIESIYFDLDKSYLTAKSIEVLDRKVALMRKYPQAVLTVIGHTCDLGTGNHNDKLSYDRADAARFYLIEKGINPTRIIPIPKGMKNPTYPNTDPNRPLNRRVDFFLAR